MKRRWFGVWCAGGHGTPSGKFLRNLMTRRSRRKAKVSLRKIEPSRIDAREHKRSWFEYD